MKTYPQILTTSPPPQNPFRFEQLLILILGSFENKPLSGILNKIFCPENVLTISEFFLSLCLGGVGTGCGNFYFTGNGDLMTSSATADELALANAASLQSVNRAPSTFWQYSSKCFSIHFIFVLFINWNFYILFYRCAS